MPNFCENDLFISGPKNRVQELLTLIGATQEKPDFDFNSLVPYPQKFLDLDKAAEIAAQNGQIVKDGFNQGGYEWCLSHWGTKWNASEFRRVGNHWSFDTAWAPPIPVIEAMIRRFPDLKITLKYYEGGMGFQGVCKHDPADQSDGDDPIIHHTESDYSGPRGG